MRRQSGFTLIELIIVIVILGILAVTAAPQFFNFGSDARASTVRGMEGSVKAAADLVYARSAIEGIEREEDATTEAESIAVAYGYPAASATGIIAALNANFGEVDGDGNFVDGADTGGDWDFTGDDPLIITPVGRTPGTATGEDRCQVEYTVAANADTRPVIEAFTEGC
ncbi:hypothetical protein CWE09_08260 [Aliidiomarina minuta]|uniref:Uncharacterized protein n=1 Tax=Aliidiomarina minuta TaxID=880057 RepID=A0A432W9A5_9GAMM|nr:prepilin-type N-terminal cleavage/methylation domain-containing protein [Aliidiomarina minuta]RUO26679.1 hypothetical protein CWE09_08260 [Aliidiomarina minuta]